MMRGRLGAVTRSPADRCASFEPDALDTAWLAIAADFGTGPAQIDIARYKLATALLSIADVEVLSHLSLISSGYPELHVHS